MKCWNSAFNAQGSRGTTVAVRVGVVKIYVAAVEALRKKKSVLMVFSVSPCLSFSPPWMLMYFFAGLKKKSHPVYDQTQGTGAVFPGLNG